MQHGRASQGDEDAALRLKVPDKRAVVDAVAGTVARRENPVGSYVPWRGTTSCSHISEVSGSRSSSGDRPSVTRIVSRSSYSCERVSFAATGEVRLVIPESNPVILVRGGRAQSSGNLCSHARCTLAK